MKIFSKWSAMFAAAVSLSSVQMLAKEPSKQKGESLSPDFTVELKLTPEAENKLKQTKRTVTVTFEFGNDLGPDSPNAVYISYEIKGNKGGKFSSKDLKLSKKQLKKIGSSYDVNIGAHSTHKTKNSLNVLDCTGADGQPLPLSNIKDIQKKNILLSCSLLK